jgi:hypothetical protein
MNIRERVLTVLRGGIPDRVPWLADFDYWAQSLERRGLRPDGFRRSPEYLDWHRELNTGFYLQGYWPFRIVPDGTVTIEEGQDGDIRYRRVITPVGSLEEQWLFLHTSYSEAPHKHFVEDVSDLKALRYWHEHIRYEPDYERAQWVKDHVGDQGVTLCYAPRSPFMQMVAEYAGIVNIVNIWYAAPGEFTETLNIMRRAHDQAAEIALASPAECLMIPENLSAEMVGRRFFENYLRDYETYWNTRIREAGKFSFVHMDGTLRGLIGPVASTGFRVIESFTPAPVGNVDVTEVRAMVEPDTVLWGGMPGAYFSPVVSDEEFEAHLNRVLDVMTTHPGFVLACADQVPPDGLAERVLRVAEAAENRAMRI